MVRQSLVQWGGASNRRHFILNENLEVRLSRDVYASNMPSTATSIQLHWHAHVAKLVVTQHARVKHAV